MQRPIEEYVKHSDKLAEDMVRTWAMFGQAGEGEALSYEFNEVFETMCEFHNAQRVANNWRRAGIPTDGVDAIAEAKRLMFAKSYKVFHENHES